MGLLGRLAGRDELGDILFGAHTALTELLRGMMEEAKGHTTPRNIMAFLGGLPFAVVAMSVKEDLPHRPFEKYVDALVAQYTDTFLSTDKGRFPRKENVRIEQDHFRNAVFQIKDEFIDLLVQEVTHGNRGTSLFKRPTERAHFYLYGTEDFDLLLSSTIVDFINGVHKLIRNKGL